MLNVCHVMSNQIAVSVLTAKRGKVRKYHLWFTVTFRADNGIGIVIKSQKVEDAEVMFHDWADRSGGKMIENIIGIRLYPEADHWVPRCDCGRSSKA